MEHGGKGDQQNGSCGIVTKVSQGQDYNALDTATWK